MSVRRLLTVSLIVPAYLCGSAYSQSTNRPQQNEVPDHRYVPVDRQSQSTSPPHRITTPGFFSVQVNVDSNGQNIVGDAANEPSIAVDPVNPNRMVIGWRQFDTIANNFRQAGNGYTTDGGLTWNYHDVIQRGIFRSDPVLDSDSDGNIYYNSLTSDGGNFTCQVFKSTDGGATWDDGVDARGGDKQWMDIDKSGGPGDGNIYAYWTQFYSICYPGFFTRSANRAASFEACVEIDGSPQWGTLAVGPESELYVCGTDFSGFLVGKSTSAADSTIPVGWDTVVTVSLDGVPGYFGGNGSPNPGGLMGQAWVGVDHSSNATRGNVYLLSSVERFSNSDPLDIMFSRSTNGGKSWSDPVRVNDDGGQTAWQWFGTMSVAPDGRIDAVWLDTRDNPGTVLSSLYYSYSTDGGESWSVNERLSVEFDPHVGWPQQDKMGDYFDMYSDSTGAHLAWAGTFNGEQDVYYGRISTLTTVTDQDPEIPLSHALLQNYPNPFNPMTEIGMRIAEPAHVTLRIYDVLGRMVATLADERLEAGEYSRTWNAAGQASGVYYYRLHAGKFVETKKLVLAR